MWKKHCDLPYENSTSKAHSHVRDIEYVFTAIGIAEVNIPLETPRYSPLFLISLNASYRANLPIHVFHFFFFFFLSANLSYRTNALLDSTWYDTIVSTRTSFSLPLQPKVFQDKLPFQPIHRYLHLPDFRFYPLFTKIRGCYLERL